MTDQSFNRISWTSGQNHVNLYHHPSNLHKRANTFYSFMQFLSISYVILFILFLSIY